MAQRRSVKNNNARENDLAGIGLNVFTPQGSLWRE
jgi:hypothetical protein